MARINSILSVTLCLLGYTSLMANDQYVVLHNELGSESVTIYGDNMDSHGRTVVLALTNLLNIVPPEKLPVLKLLPPQSKNVLVVELKKDFPDDSFQYLYSYTSFRGEKITGPVNKLGLPIWKEKGDSYEVEEPDEGEPLEYERPDDCLFDISARSGRFGAGPADPGNPMFVVEPVSEAAARGLVTGNSITDEAFDGFSYPLERTRMVTLRTEKIDKAVIYFAQNGCAIPREVNLEFQELTNMVSSKMVPYTTIVPPLTEKYLLFIRCNNDSPYGARSNFTFK